MAPTEGHGDSIQQLGQTHEAYRAEKVGETLCRGSQLSLSPGIKDLTEDEHLTDPTDGTEEDLSGCGTGCASTDGCPKVCWILSKLLCFE